MPKFSTYVDVDIHEFMEECSKREIKELIDYLVENRHIKASSKITPSRQKVTSMELEHMEVCTKLSSLLFRMNNEECDILKQIASKY